MPRTYPQGKPSAYAGEKLSTLLSRWDSAIGATLRQMSAVVFPGIPAEALLGFTAICTSPQENTTEGTPAQQFHEIGLFQVEAGLRGGPAPNPDPEAEYNNWGALHDTKLVQKLLGRPATMEPNRWKTEIADQIAVGLANLRRHGIGVGPALDARIRPQDPAGEWHARVMFTAYSRGWGQTARVLNRYASRLAGTIEQVRWTELRRLIAGEAKAGIEPGSKMGRSGPAYAAIRTDQKMRSGWMLAGALGADRSWWTSEYGAQDGEVEDVLARIAYGVGLPMEQAAADSDDDSSRTDLTAQAEVPGQDRRPAEG